MVIAEADYGMKAKSTMQELRIIRDNGSVTAEVSGQLFEVLTLTRYSEPDDHTPFSKPDPYAYAPHGYSGHQARLFACALLLRMHADPQHGFLDSNDKSTLGKCLVSAKVLGNELGEALARFLTWQLSSLEEGDDARCIQLYDPVFYSLALLILAMRLRPDRMTENEIGLIAEWVLAQESQAPRWYPPPPVSFSVGSGFWRPLAAELRDGMRSIRDGNTRELLEIC